MQVRQYLLVLVRNTGNDGESLSQGGESCVMDLETRIILQD